MTRGTTEHGNLVIVVVAATVVISMAATVMTGTGEVTMITNS